MSSYALYMPVSAAVPDTSNGAVTITFASVMPAVVSALIYISEVHQLICFVVICNPLPGSPITIYVQESATLPIFFSGAMPSR